MLYRVYDKDNDYVEVEADYAVAMDDVFEFYAEGEPDCPIAVFAQSEFVGYSPAVPRRGVTRVKLDDGAVMPTRAHALDAGYDLYMPSNAIDATLFPHDSLIIDTGVHVEIPAGYAGFLKSKSGLNVKHDITSEGVIDAGYTGSIVVKLYNNGDREHCIHAGDKISQLVLLPVSTPQMVQVDALPDTERGDNGFGSTGR